MQDNVLVRAFGDNHTIQVIAFFLEHPIHSFTITDMSEYLGISRDTLKKDLEFFETRGYVKRTSSRGPYKLRLGDEMVQFLLKCTAEMSKAHVMAEEKSVAEELYIKRAVQLPAGNRRISAASA